MVQIDGTKVRSLREAKGLTQLYIATVVGVTTDTISRWENRRYPSIKEENALKLAEALEVTVDDILEKNEQITEPEKTPTEIVSQSRPLKSYRVFIWLMILAFVLLMPFIWYSLNKPEQVTILATRLLPPHIPVNQPFPVIIHVETKQQGPFSLILKETLPADCEPLVSDPPFSGIDRKKRNLKWIIRTDGQTTTFVYLARRLATESVASKDVSLRFNGSVTLRDKKSSETVIAGSQILPLADYHWADANRDNRIEDNEILDVYDTFSALDNIEYDWQQIDEIWSGEGYRWDADEQRFVIQQ